MPRRKSFAVHWTRTAESDLASIADRVATDNPEAAERILEKIEETASRLTQFPLRGRVVPELKEHGIVVYHELICHPWRIICRIEAGTVLVMAAIDGRRNLEDLLLERFLH